MNDSILNFARTIDSSYGYLLLGLCAFIENIIPPIPGDTVTIFGGYLSGIGRLSLTGVLLSTTAGSFAGFMCLFYIGKALGRRLLEAKRLYFFSTESLIRVTGWFERFGYGVVLGNRFFSGARSVISLGAGISNLHSAKVALYSLLSCFIWNALLITAGHKVGENWRQISGIIREYNTIVLCVLGLVLVIWAVRKRFSKGTKA